LPGIEVKALKPKSAIEVEAILQLVAGHQSQVIVATVNHWSQSQPLKSKLLLLPS